MGLRKVGALWLKEGKKGKFMSGEYQPDGRNGPKTHLLIFKNGKKDKPNDPDYLINVADDDEPKKEQTSGHRSDDEEQPPF